MMHVDTRKLFNVPRELLNDVSKWSALSLYTLPMSMPYFILLIIIKFIHSHKNWDMIEIS